VNGLRKAGERYTAVSAYKAAIASTSRRGQARDHVSAQRRAADSVSTVITEFRLMLASVGDPDDDITRLLLGLCSSHTPARPMALINSALGETMGNEAITSKGEGWCCDRQRLPGLTQAAFAPGRAQRCWRLRRRVGSRRCLRYCRWLLVRVSLLVRTTTRRARRSPFRAARSRRCVLVGAHRPMISSAMEQRPPPLSAIFSDLDTTEVGRSAPRPANSGAAAKVLRID